MGPGPQLTTELVHFEGGPLDGEALMLRSPLRHRLQMPRWPGIVPGPTLPTFHEYRLQPDPGGFTYQYEGVV